MYKRITENNLQFLLKLAIPIVQRTELTLEALTKPAVCLALSLAPRTSVSMPQS